MPPESLDLSPDDFEDEPPAAPLALNYGTPVVKKPSKDATRWTSLLWWPVPAAALLYLSWSAGAAWLRTLWAVLLAVHFIFGLVTAWLVFTGGGGPNAAARKFVRRLRRVHEAAGDGRPFDPRAHAGLFDIEDLDRRTRELEALGFRTLADVHNPVAEKATGDVRAFTRLFVGDDGRVLVSLMQTRRLGLASRLTPAAERLVRTVGAGSTTEDGVEVVTLACDTRHATRDTRHATRDTRHATRDTRHATRDTRHATRARLPAGGATRGAAPDDDARRSAGPPRRARP